MSNFSDIIRATLRFAQEVEDGFQQLLVGLGIEFAIGTQLDMVGEKVGQARLGLDDDAYLRMIYARILANKSNGTIAELRAIIELVINAAEDPGAPTYTVVTSDEMTGGATLVFLVVNEPLPDELRERLMSFLNTPVSGGVRLIIESTQDPIGTTFKWDTAGRGWDSGAPWMIATQTA